MATKIFISYTHDSADHQDRVLSLSERLRQDGIETLLDQYVNGSPQQGWPRWMLDQLDEADWVLVVCSETYYRRFRGREQPGKGRGADWEGALITQEIYDSRSRSVKFVPVFLTVFNEEWIPDPLRAVTYYQLTSQSAYDSLYDFLTGQGGVRPGPIGRIKSRPSRQAAALIFDESVAAGAAAVAGETGRAVDYYRRALRWLSDGDVERALGALSRVIELDPTMAVAYYNRGVAHNMTEANGQAADRESELRLAIEDFDRALSLGFHDALLFRNRGNAFSRQGDVARALNDYAQAIALDPRNPLAYLNRGEVYANTLQNDLAIADYTTVLGLVTEEQWHDEARSRLLTLGVKA